MPESFVQDAWDMGYPPDWDGSSPKREIYIDPKKVTEIISDISAEDLKTSILRNIWEEQFHSIQLVNQCYRGDGFIPISSLDGLNEDSKHLHAYYFKCFLESHGECEFSARFLMKILRDKEIPFIFQGEDNGWIVWSNHSNSLRVHQPETSILIKNIQDLRAKEYQGKDPQAVNILSRCQISTDHGQKPILVLKSEVGHLIAGNHASFKHPEYIKHSQTNKYTLAFLDSSGSVNTIDLDRATRLRMKIHTRSCTYEIKEDGIHSTFNHAYLYTNAFILASKVHPNHMGCFQYLPSGTIYQSSIITRDIPEIKYSTTGKEVALAMALNVRSHTEKLGKIYLTNGLHPLDEYIQQFLPNHFHCVTTPELYEKAVKKILACGFCLNVDRNNVSVSLHPYA